MQVIVQALRILIPISLITHSAISFRLQSFKAFFNDSSFKIQ
jgi:hypothetical protein